MTPALARTAEAEPFGGVTGRGVKIAVIDSGVNVSHPHILAKTEGISIAGVTEDAVDQLGHGTAVMAAIQEKAPGAAYFAVKLFGSSLRTTTERLLQALEWAIAKKVDIVNLSLGTPNFDYQGEFESLTDRAARAGTLVVSARSAGERPVLPGCLEEVISVDVDWELARDRFRTAHSGEGRQHFLASGFPRSLPGMTAKRNLHGISFAVANMTGFVARAVEVSGSRNLRVIRDLLAAESARFNSH